MKRFSRLPEANRISVRIQSGRLWAVCIAALVFACNIDPVSSGGAGAETTNGISARVLDPTGSPVADAEVTISPDTFLILDTGSLGDKGIWPRKTKTDSTGLFRFDSLPADTYAVEVVTADGRGIHLRTAVGTGSSSFHYPGDLTVQPLRRVQGSVSRDYIDSTITLRIGIYGLNRTVELDKSDYFRIHGIPPGTYRAILTSSRPDVTGSEVFTLRAAHEDSSTWNHVPALPIVRHNDSLRITAYFRAQGIPVSAWDSIIGTFSKRVYLLDLSRRGITAIHPSIADLHMVFHLDFGHNPLSSLPAELADMSQLRHLVLDSVSVAPMWSDIIKLDQLTNLSLSNNNLASLPPGLQNLKSLRRLFLNSNRLDSVPSEIFECREMVELQLRSNSLKVLSPRIANLIRLEELDLGDNELSDLPPEIGSLISLTHLTASGNSLSRLPEEIGTCTNLTHLLVDDNSLTVLPSSLGDLENLSRFSLKNNLLQTLPSSLIQLRLDYLNVKRNRLCGISEELRGWIDVVSNDLDWEGTQECL